MGNAENHEEQSRLLSRLTKDQLIAGKLRKPIPVPVRGVASRAECDYGAGSFMSYEGARSSASDFGPLFGAIPHPCLVLATDLTIVAASEAYLRDTRSVRAEIIGRNLLEVFPDPASSAPDEVSALRESLHRVLSEHESDTMNVQRFAVRRSAPVEAGLDERYVSVTNSPVLDAAGEVAWIIHDVTDVTNLVKVHQQGTAQLKETETLQTSAEEMERDVFKWAQDQQDANAHLRARQSSLSEAQAISHVGSFEWEIGTNAVTWSDEQFRIFGYPPGSVETDYKLFIDAVQAEDRLRVDAAYQSCVASGGPLDAEFGIVRPDGTVRWIRQRGLISFDNGSIVRIVGSTPVRLVGSTEDVTASKFADKERSTLEAQLRQAHKMEAVGQLAGGIAHDFNNLIAVILNYAEFVRETLDEDHEGLSDLEQIVKASERGAELIRQLLAFSRREVIQPTVIDLNEVVAGMAILLDRSVGEEIELGIETRPGLSLAKADHGQIEQILLNLVINARDSMPDGGRIKISTFNEELETGMRMGLPAGDYVCLMVTDTGTGIDAETIDRIFEPFFTTKARGDGTGLGLATVYGIVKQAQGGIYAESEKGTMTSFTVYLPVTDEEMSAPVELVPKVAFVEATVLVVEDEEMVRELIVRILRREGFDVIDVASGAEAVEICSAKETKIDLLLTDVVMPRMSGPAVRDAVLPLRPELSVLFMSGYTDELIAKHGVLDVGDNLIKKPFNSNQLLARVRDALNLEEVR